MGYGLLADLVVMAHLGFLAFLAVGGLFAWHWPRVAWPHVAAVGWGIAAITVGVVCPLTQLEKYFRRLSGESVYPGGFIDHYLTGVLYPQRLTWLVRAVVAVLIVVGYARLLATRHRRRQRASDRARARGGSAPADATAPD